jgi:NAD(P)-dependent dehydrogenase (short-subunit alcohol dehydrogenase family)
MAEGRVVLVTGAAGAIGGAAARAFLGAGFGVVGLDRDPSVAEVGDRGYRGIRVELADERALAAAMDEAATTGPLAHVVGVAGGAFPDEPATQEDPAKVTPELFRASIEAHLTTQFLVLRAALPWLRRQAGDRSVTFTSSWNALAGLGMPAYSAAKAGLIGMMRALVGPLGREGVRVNVVAPGTVRTPRTERLWEGVPGHFDRLEAESALGRLATPEDVARAFVALATQLTHVTGQVLVVDGGQLVVRGRAGT